MTRRARILLVAVMLVMTGALAGFVTAQFLPHAFVATATVSFTEPVGESRCTYAAGQTLAPAALKPIVLQSAYYRPELDFTPEDEIIERIRQSAVITCLKVSGKEGFHIAFTDPDRYLTLEMARVLVAETGKNALATMRMADPIRTHSTGPGPADCVLLGAGAGLALALLLALAGGLTH